jgi:hypothetical protein
MPFHEVITLLSTGGAGRVADREQLGAGLR